MGDKYRRLVILLVKICPRPLRKLFLKYMNADPKRQFSSLGDYLLYRKTELTHLKTRKIIREDQWDLLFPLSGQANESSWDISLLSQLINKFFSKQLQNIELVSMNEIRDIRNEFMHKADDSLSDMDFDDMWSRLETAALNIAKKISPVPTYAKEIEKSIDNAKVNNMPELDDALHSWDRSIILEQNFKIRNMEESILKVSENTEENLRYVKESQAILEDSSVGPSGRPLKRLKTYNDDVLRSLSQNFATNFDEKLPSDIFAASEVQSIKAKLQNYHHVVVTGPEGSRIIEAALAAIHDLPLINRHRCVELKNASDWRHINPEDVDLVLCKYPFGHSRFEYKRANDMNDILRSMYQATKDSDRGQYLTVVIVTEEDIFHKFTTISSIKHEILAEVVSIREPTSETNPVDLTCNPSISTDVEIKDCFKNLIDLSVIVAESYHEMKSTLSENVVREAKVKLKQHKVIIITGPRKCGKTTLAALLTSVYSAGEYLFINKADDIKYVPLQRVCLVVVEDFAGKYQYDPVSARDWMRMFDIILTAVKAGKLNMILTCEEEFFDKCKSDFENHQIFDGNVKMNISDIRIKRENDEYEQPSNKSSHAGIQRETSDGGIQRETSIKRQLFDNRRLDDLKIQTFVLMHINTTSLSKNSDCRITELCLFAVSRKCFSQTERLPPRKPSLPRIVNKLVMCFNPAKYIQEKASAISGLTNEQLHATNQQRLTMNSVFSIKEFLSNLQEPFCFVAHNGNAFDFSVLKAELKRLDLEKIQISNTPNYNSDLSEEMEGFENKTAQFDLMWCADSLVFLRHIYVKGYSSKSFALRSLYKTIFGKPPKKTETAEGFCVAMLHILQKQPYFVKWMDKNAVRMGCIKPAY